MEGCVFPLTNTKNRCELKHKRFPLVKAYTRWHVIWQVSSWAPTMFPGGEQDLYAISNIKKGSFQLFSLQACSCLLQELPLPIPCVQQITSNVNAFFFLLLLRLCMCFDKFDKYAVLYAQHQGNEWRWSLSSEPLLYSALICYHNKQTTKTQHKQTFNNIALASSEGKQQPFGVVFGKKNCTALSPICIAEAVLASNVIGLLWRNW